MKKLLLFAMTGVTMLLTSCSGGKSSSSTPLFGSLVGEYAEFAEKEAELKEKAQNVTSEEEKAKLLKEQKELEEKWSVKIEKAAKSLDGKPVEIAEGGEFKVTEPISLTFEDFVSKKSLAPKFKVTGKAEAVNEIDAGDYILPRRIVYVVGYDAEGTKLYSNEIGTIDVVNQDGHAIIAAGTPVEFTTLRFSSSDVENYLKATALKLELEK